MVGGVRQGSGRRKLLVAELAGESRAKPTHLSIYGRLQARREGHIMKKTMLLMAMVIALAMSTMAVSVANDDVGYGDPNKVWLCHFDGHEIDEPYEANAGTITGDYIIQWSGPVADDGYPSDFCANLGGNPILVSVNSVGDDSDVRGHGAQFTNRISDYPNGYKG